MKIILCGYGTMGKIVRDLAIDMGHEIVAIYSNRIDDSCSYPIIDKVKNLPEADLIIDFSHPERVANLLRGANIHKTPIVVATTGQREYLQKLMEDASKYIPVFFSANMSYGVHVFTQALKFLTPLLSDGFDIEILERHHNKKIDAPSGTAIKLLESIQSIDSSYKPIYDRSKESHRRDKKEIGMSSIRGGTIVGEHEVLFAGNDEVIEIVHKAQSKKIFADGAIKAGQILVNKKPGLYNFDNL